MPRWLYVRRYEFTNCNKQLVDPAYRSQANRHILGITERPSSSSIHSPLHDLLSTAFPIIPAASEDDRMPPWPLGPLVRLSWCFAVPRELLRQDPHPPLYALLHETHPLCEPHRAKVLRMGAPLHAAEPEARWGRGRQIEAVTLEDTDGIASDVCALECGENDDKRNLRREVRRGSIVQPHDACKATAFKLDMRCIWLRFIYDREENVLGIPSDDALVVLEERLERSPRGGVVA